MHVTVAICTRNRASLLEQTLESLAHARIPDGITWELVVVDNNSTDNTNNVIMKYEKRLPVLREFESVLGLAHARNRAVVAASGSYIIWTDDDTVVDPEFVCAYVDAFRRWPEAACFGGKVIPVLEEPVPSWIKDAWATIPIVPSAFAFRDYGDDPVPLSLLSPRRIPVGANFAVRLTEQRAYVFNGILGPRSGSPSIASEDSYLFESMLQDGHTGVWVPSAKVQHSIPRERQSIRSLRDHCLFIGRGEAFRDQNSKTPRLLGAPRWLWRRTVASGLRYFFSRLTYPRRVWLKQFADYYLDRGSLEYWLRLHSMD